MFQDFEEQSAEVRSEGGEHEVHDIDHVFQDFGNQASGQKVQSHDALVFIVDCSKQIMTPLPGDQYMIMMGLNNTLKNKIISSPQDRVGLILYNVRNGSNQLKFSQITAPIRLEPISAETIRLSKRLVDQFEQLYGIAQSKAAFHEVLWLYNHQLKNMYLANQSERKTFLADIPVHSNEADRELALNHGRKLIDQNVQFQIFPLRKSRASKFDIKKFYQEIITLDLDEINKATLDATSKIMQLQQRLRQKEHKKRTLNRLFLELDQHTKMGIKAKKPLAKKLDARSNKLLKRNVKFLCKQTGQALYNNQIESFYPLGGQKVKIGKKDIAKIKAFQPPGMTLIGFKPRSSLKAKHNYRASYFIYPDEERVLGSSTLADALIKQMCEKQKIAIVKFIPRAGSALRFCALVPQKQTYDEDHFQVAPGFHLIFLPFADDISKPKIQFKPQPFSEQLLCLTKLLINNLTLQDYHPKNFENPALQKFYSHLQAHALNQPQLEAFQDLLQPDEDAFFAASQIMGLIQQTLDVELGSKKPAKKAAKKADVQKKSKVKKEEKIQEEDENQWQEMCENLLTGRHTKVKVAQLKQFLASKHLATGGKKEQLIERVLNFLK